MTNKVLKYKLAPDVRGTRLPIGYRPLFVGHEKGELMLWVLSDDAMDSSPGPDHFTTYNVYGTGWAVPGDHQYVGTAQMPDGLVWHVFREGG